MSDDLYIRWKTDRSPYPVELKMSLVGPVATEIAAARARGAETGGLLLGVLTEPGPTMRIDEVALLPHRTEDGPVFLLSPQRRKKADEIRAAAKAKGLQVLGLLRSHQREGAPQPSLADRAILMSLFRDAPLYSFLLIRDGEPNQGSFYLASGGELPLDPSIPDFRFDQAALLALPRVEDRTPARLQPEPIPLAPAPPAAVMKPPARPALWRGYLTFAAILTAVCACLAGGFLYGGFGSRLQPTMSGAGLAIVEGESLRIVWKHDAPAVLHASGAKLVINDGGAPRELTLSADDLKFGSVEYPKPSTSLTAVLSLEFPGAVTVSQNASWKPGR